MLFRRIIEHDEKRPSMSWRESAWNIDLFLGVIGA
jgi:hypothetical protein